MTRSDSSAAPFSRRERLGLATAAGILLVAGVAAWVALTPVQEDPYRKLRPRLPAEVAGWRAAGGDREYDDQTIFQYIDGGGEVYRAYNMRLCLARRYERAGQPALLLDLFDMGRPADAFGVFTHDLEGEPAGIGMDSRYRPGWLTFWQGRFYVSVTAEAETPEAGRAVRELGRRLAALIPREGGRPEILSLLPPSGLAAERVVYFHHPVILSAHLYLEDTAVLQLSPRTPAVLAEYRRDDLDPAAKPAKLLLVVYPTAAQAAQVRADFAFVYLEDQADAGLARAEDGTWIAVGCAGRRLAVVLDAASPLVARDLLREALR